MFTLIVGGSASGKSALAESLFKQPGPYCYIATMEAFDEECRRRIERHRAQRAGREFKTVECLYDLAGLTLPPCRGALLEDMGKLVANELYSPRGGGAETEKAVLDGIDNLLAQCGNLVVVGNEVFTGGNKYAGDTLRYMRVLAKINRALAARRSRAVEVVCGLPITHKGGPV